MDGNLFVFFIITVAAASGPRPCYHSRALPAATVRDGRSAHL